MSRIIKSSQYKETDLTALGLRVLTSSSSAAAQIDAFSTPPGLTLEEWRDRVAKIEADASQRATQIIEAAKAEAQELRAAAEERGYTAGYSKGYEEGYAKGEREAKTYYQREWDSRIAQLSAVLDEVLNFRAALVEHYKSDIVELAIEVAKAVIRTDVDRDDSVVLNVIEECLRKASSPTTLTIKVNLADLPVVVEAKRDIAARFPTLESIEVVDDPSVERGGCLIETDSGFLDGRIDQQVDRIKKALDRALREG